MSELSEKAEKIFFLECFFQIVLEKRIDDLIEGVYSMFPIINLQIEKESQESLMKVVKSMIKKRKLHIFLRSYSFSKIPHEEIKMIVEDHFYKALTMEGGAFHKIHARAWCQQTIVGCGPENVTAFLDQLCTDAIKKFCTWR
jgi:hypothetical protein